MDTPKNKIITGVFFFNYDGTVTAEDEVPLVNGTWIVLDRTTSEGPVKEKSAPKAPIHEQALLPSFHLPFPQDEAEDHNGAHEATRHPHEADTWACSLEEKLQLQKIEELHEYRSILENAEKERYRELGYLNWKAVREHLKRLEAMLM